MQQMSQHNEISEPLKKRGYQVIEKIGSGSFADVYLIVKDEVRYAVKVVTKSVDESLEKLVLHEIHIMQYYSKEKPQICTAIDNFETPFYYCIIMKYYPADLQKLLLLHKPLSERTAIEIMKQVYNGVYFLHGRNIIHRDIKPANILIECSFDAYDAFKKKQIKPDQFILQSKFILSDFGVSKKMNQKFTNTVTGSNSTMAPEVRSGNHYSYSADIYSLGQIFYLMLMGAYPKSQYLQFASHITQQTQNLVSRMVHLNPNQRPTTTDLDNFFQIQRFKLRSNTPNPSSKPQVDNKTNRSISNNGKIQLIESRKQSQSQIQKATPIPKEKNNYYRNIQFLTSESKSNL